MNTTNEQLITTFYKAFQQKDYATMQQCYAENAIFNDEAFKNLNAAQVRAMWQMLISRGKDLEISFKNIESEGNKATAEWIATYTFSQTKRKVVNHIKANFVIENGKIITHTDQFNFYKWSRQSLGLVGYVLGWTGFLRKKVSETAMKSLSDFMAKKG